MWPSGPGDIGWAFRKGGPKLAAAVNRFIAANRKGTTLGNELFNRYLRSAEYVKNALHPDELRKYNADRRAVPAVRRALRLRRARC